MKKNIYVAVLCLMLTPALFGNPFSEYASQHWHAIIHRKSQKELILIGSGIMLCAVGAYSMKRSIDIFVQSSEERQSFFNLLRRCTNTAFAGGFGLSTATLGILMAYFSKEIAYHTTRHYTAPL